MPTTISASAYGTQPGSGTFGGTEGLAVQKIVGGVVTQISPAGIGIGAATPITQAMIDCTYAFDLKVAVMARCGYDVLFNGTPIVSGTDAGLVDSSGKIGISVLGPAVGYGRR